MHAANPRDLHCVTFNSGQRPRCYVRRAVVEAQRAVPLLWLQGQVGQEIKSCQRKRDPS
jgi:hypothetical protein